MEEQTRQNILAMLEFVKQLSIMRQKTVNDIAKQPGSVWMRDLEQHPEFIKLFSRTEGDGTQRDGALLLRIVKPDLEPCPAPPEILLPWLKPGWTSYKKDANHLTERIYPTDTTVDSIDGNIGDGTTEKEPTDVQEAFEDDMERVATYKAWSDHRAIWVEKQKQLSVVQGLFSDLYFMYNLLRQQPESYELMVGNGVLTDRTDNTYNHPVFLKRVNIELIAEENTILVSDSDASPELYVMLLGTLNDVHNDIVKKVEDDARERDIHPLDHQFGQILMKGLVMQLTSDSVWADEGQELEENVRIMLRWAPVFFLRKKIDGTARTINIIKGDIEQGGPVPETVINIVNPTTYTVDENDEVELPEAFYETGAKKSSVAEEILLPKPANKEQLEIARQVQHNAAVLVQGPPGTGKTHTIANLVSHFLAQGKRILITSQTNKALNVLKEKIPEPMQPLCVAMLNDSNSDMERSVDDIVEYITTHSVDRARQKAEAQRKLRASLQKEQNEAQTLVRQMLHSEFEPITWCGNNLSPSKAAMRIAEQADKLSIIPGKITEGESFPLTETELIELYARNDLLNPNEETELVQGLPDVKAIIPPDMAAQYWKNVENERHHLDEISNDTEYHFIWSSKDYSIADEFSGKICMHSADSHIVDTLVALQYQCPEKPSVWMIGAVVDGSHDSLRRRKWCALLDNISSTCDIAMDAQKAMYSHTIVIAPDIAVQTLTAQYEQLCHMASNSGKLSRLAMVGHKELRSAVETVTLDGLHPASYEEMLLIFKWLKLQCERQKLISLWDEMMLPFGEPSATTYGNAPEEILQYRKPELIFWLTWSNKGIKILTRIAQQIGIDLPFFNNLSSLDLTNELNVSSLLHELHRQIGKSIVMANCIQLLTKSARFIQETQALLINHKDSALCHQLLCALMKQDESAYMQDYSALTDVAAKMPAFIRRCELLEKIKLVAPQWSEAVYHHASIHGHVNVPAYIQDSWQLKQLDMIVSKICSTPLPEAENRVSLLKTKIQKVTAELATDLAWYHLLDRLNGNLRIQSILTGWKQTIKKIGKGTGKNAAALRIQAQELMAASQQAIPAWIMPIGKVMDSINPSKTDFDIVIIDEASQADITAIPIFFMGKKIIIVGDDEQVSPMAIGIPEDKMNALRDTYIKGLIPNWHLFDATYSIYALAGSICKPLMLQEHFRCVPDIIGYSNWLSYNGKIKPLREAGNVAVRPAVIPFHVEGQRTGKTNLSEAETIVAAIQAFMEMPEYKDETFGVISMLGDEQVKLIDRLLFEHISLVDRENRHILCGNASNFQGDERSVVLLSLVDNNEGDGPLRRMTEGKGDSNKQRYNVAVSRAQNQIWIMYSMDPTMCLKKGDIRRGLLDYANDPQSYCQKIKQIEHDSESPFEEEVAKYLVTDGYQVTQQYPVGGYRLDMVVSCNGKRIALECDGERYHNSEEEIQNDTERQSVLERLGWQFIRLRGSEFFRDKQRAIDRIRHALDEAGIVPEEPSRSNDDFSQQNALKQKVATRIQQIIHSWHADDDNDNLFITLDIHPAKENNAVLGKNPRCNTQPSTGQNTLNEPVATNHPFLTATENTALSEQIQRTPTASPASDRHVNSIQASSYIAAQETRAHTPRAIQPLLDNFNEESTAKTDFLKALDEASFQYIDNRGTSGILWVLYNSNRKEAFEQLAASYDIKATLEKRGAVATANHSAWRIMKYQMKE